jgi:hypothetical protein
MIEVMSNVLRVYLFQENKSYSSKNHLHSSSDVQESRVRHTNKMDIIFMCIPIQSAPSFWDIYVPVQGFEGLFTEDGQPHEFLNLQQRWNASSIVPQSAVTKSYCCFLPVWALAENRSHPAQEMRFHILY